jgi:hypothetical protein
MSRITINELSSDLKEYLNGLGLTESQVQELIDKSEDEKIGDISQLNTDSKDLVGAINELFQNANNGKELIADAIGEPLNSNDTFSAMSDKIINLLYKFRTNMANSGVVVEGGDNFEQLIDKITIMAEEGKGVRYNAGAYSLGEVRTFDEFYGGQWADCDYQSINIPKAFDMNFIYVYTDYNYPIIDPDSGRTYDVYAMDCIIYDPLVQTLDDGTPYVFAHNIYDVYDAETGEQHNWGNWSTYVKLIDDTDHVSLPLIGSYYMEPNPLSYDNITFNSYYAVGFGEEDTKLRNSLASILQDEGVSVTEEDNMDSLIAKVDTVIDNKNTEMQAEKQKLVNFLTAKQINVSMSNTMEEITIILAENLPKVVTASDNVLASYSAYFEYNCPYKGSLKVTYTITVSPAYADTNSIGTTLHHRRNGSDVNSWYSYHSTSNGTSATYTRTITGIEPGDVIFADAAFSYISSAKICGTVS